jgi:hypothetical protein
VSLPAPEKGSPAEQLERDAASNPRWALRENLARFYASPPEVERRSDGVSVARWTVDEVSGREARTAWRVDELSGYVYLESLERGDRTGKLSPGTEPAASPCIPGCPLSSEAAPTDPVPMLAAPGLAIPAGHGPSRVLRFASARANLYPYLPRAALILPVGDKHGRPATWPLQATAETLLLAAYFESLAREALHWGGLEIFHNLGHEAFGSQEHPHLQVVPRPASLPWEPAPGLPRPTPAALRDPANELARRGRFTARLNRGTGDPWIDPGDLECWAAMSFEDCLHLAELWRRIDRAYALAGCHHLNAPFHAPDFRDGSAGPLVAFAPRERGWGRGRAGFELLHRDRVWVTARPVEALGEHFRRVLAAP